VAHDDGGLVEGSDDPAVVVGDLGQAEVVDPGGVGSQCVDVAVHTGPALGDHAEAVVGVSLDPVLPAEGG